MLRFIQTIRRRTPLGWLQLSHQKSRLIVAISGIAFADILMFMQLGFQGALYDSNTRLNRSLNADIVLISTKAKNMQSLSTFSRRRLFQAKDIKGVESAEAMYINVIKWKNPQTREETSIQILGIEPDKPVLNLPELDQQLSLVKLPDTFLFDKGTKGQYTDVITQIEQGKTVNTEIQGRTINLRGLFFLGTSFGADGNLITSGDNFLRLFPRRKSSSISLGLINLESGYDPVEVAKDLKYRFRDFDDIRIFTHKEFVEFENNYWATESPVGFIFGLGTAMGFVVGVILVYQILSTDVNAHMKEYATFKAMGYRNFYLLSIVFEEAIILAILGFIPGSIVPLGLYQLTRNATNLPIAMNLGRAIVVFLLTVIMCTISGAIATTKVQSADPADMF